MSGYISIAVGFALCCLSFEPIRRITIEKLQVRGVLPRPARNIKRQELFVGAGPGLSLFVCGGALIIIGIVLALYE